MKTKIEIEIIPFSVPESVTLKESPGPREDGFKPSAKIKLSTLSEETLEKLCDDFREKVFKKAGKSPNRGIIRE